MKEIIENIIVVIISIIIVFVILWRLLVPNLFVEFRVVKNLFVEFRVVKVGKRFRIERLSWFGLRKRWATYKKTLWSCDGVHFYSFKETGKVGCYAKDVDTIIDEPTRYKAESWLHYCYGELECGPGFGITGGI